MFAAWSANRIDPRVQLIAAERATLEVGSANSRVLFSHVFFSPSVLAITVLLKVMVMFHLSRCAGNVVKTILTQHGLLQKTEIL